MRKMHWPEGLSYSYACIYLNATIRNIFQLQHTEALAIGGFVAEITN